MRPKALGGGGMLRVSTCRDELAGAEVGWLEDAGGKWLCCLTAASRRGRTVPGLQAVETTRESTALCSAVKGGKAVEAFSPEVRRDSATGRAAGRRATERRYRCSTNCQPLSSSLRVWMEQWLIIERSIGRGAAAGDRGLGVGSAMAGQETRTSR
jgi:hypothetical protein